MMRRFVSLLIFVPLAIVLIALAVANRGAVAFTIDAFSPGNPSLTWQAPLFVLLFVSLAAGMIVGSFATWLTQGRHRRAARQGRSEAERLLAEAKLRAGRAALVAA